MTIEGIICDYLSRKLNCTVLPEKPQRPFGKMVFVEKTGGTGQFIKHSTIALQSYDDSLYKAASLNDDVIDAMYGLIEHDKVCHVELNSNYNYTDTTTGEYRYQAVFEVVHY